MSEITKDFIKLIAQVILALVVVSVIFVPSGIIDSIFSFETYAEPVTLLSHLSSAITTLSHLPGEASSSFKTSGMPYIIKIYKEGENFYLDMDFRLVTWKTNVKYEPIKPIPVISDCDIKEQELALTEGIIQEITVKKIKKTGGCEIFVVTEEKPFDFKINVTPESGYVVNGSSVSALVSVRVVDEKIAPEAIELTASGLPNGITVSFSKNSLEPNFDSLMTIYSANATPAGTYLITVEGKSAFLHRWKNFELEVGHLYYTLILESKADIVNLPISNVKVNVSNITKYTSNHTPLISNVVYGLLRESYEVSVENPFNSYNRGLWHFDESSGDNVNDSSSYKNLGTRIGTTWQPSANCHSGNCLLFDGVDDYVSIPANPSLDIVNEITTEAWIKPVFFTNWARILAKGISPNSAYILSLADSNNIGFILKGPSFEEGCYSPTNTIIAGNWYHALGVYNGTHMKVIIDDQEVNCKVVNGPLPYSGIINIAPGDLNIGRDPIGGEYFNGLIDEVRIAAKERSFSHFRDYDCDNLGYVLDTTDNPHLFNITNETRNMIAYYKAFTKITDTAGRAGIFEFNGATVKGRLIDEKNNALIANGGKHPLCENPTTLETPVPINRDVTLEYYDNSWHTIGTVTASAAPNDGSWSLNWNCASGAKKLRASYKPTNWFYEEANAEIPINCQGNLDIHAYVGAPGVDATVAIGLGDVDWDGDVDSDDLWFYDGTNPNSCLDTRPGEPLWDIDCDMKRDNVIDIFDFTVVSIRQGGSTIIGTTPFIAAVNPGTYNLRAKYDNQIINKENVVVNLAQTTTVDFNFLPCDGFSALDCSEPGLLNPLDMRLWGNQNCGRSNAKLDCDGNYNSHNVCDLGGACSRLEPTINSYSQSSNFIEINDNFSIDVSGSCPNGLRGNCLMECRVIHPDGYNIELDSWDDDGSATLPNITCDRTGNYTIDYCVVYTDFTINRGWGAFDNSNRTVKCKTSMCVVNGVCESLEGEDCNNCVDCLCTAGRRCCPIGICWPMAMPCPD